MRTLPAILSTLTVGCVAWVAIGLRGEEITAEALAPVPLYDANTVAGPWGTKLVIVETLRAGEAVRVTECRDRKSDIELLTVRAGLPVVIAGDSRSLRLHRRDVAAWSPNSTTSCRGFFQSMSVVSMADSRFWGTQ
jgi:hypothetical protein